MIVFVLAAALAAAAEPATDGVEGLCAQVAHVAGPQVASRPTALQVIAEGPAIELAETVAGRCTTQLLGRGQSPATLASAERIVRLRLRVAAPQLVALVEVTTPGHGTTPGDVLVAQAVEVAAGPTLTRWLSASGSGLETWLAGSLEGEVLGLCGADSDDDGTPEVAFLTRSAIEIARWTSAGFDHVTRIDLPPSLRARARAPGASMACRAIDGALVIAFGVHDRGRGGILRVLKGDAQPLQPIEGIPFGLNASGQPIVADSVPGTGLVRWRGQTLAAITAAPVGKGLHIVGVTQTGALWMNEQVGRPFTAGAGLTIADVDGNNTPDAVLTRPVFASGAADDQLLVTALDNPSTVRHQSAPIRGVFGPVGTVTVGSWQRVLAVQWSGGRSQIYALGKRLPLTAAR